MQQLNLHFGNLELDESLSSKKSSFGIFWKGKECQLIS